MLIRCLTSWVFHVDCAPVLCLPACLFFPFWVVYVLLFDLVIKTLISSAFESSTSSLLTEQISTGLQTQGDYIGRQTRVTRETQLEPLKQWLSNKMGGDRQSTWEHMAPTNNKPCAQHTETSGNQPGHTSRTVTPRDRFLDPFFSPHTLHHWVPSYRHMASPTFSTLMTHSSISHFDQMIQR